jgi:hypothetical protein
MLATTVATSITKAINEDDTRVKSTKHTRIRIRANKPNPFTKNTIIRYSIPQGSRGQISIYDQAGKLVKTPNANSGGQSQVSGHELAAGA